MNFLYALSIASTANADTPFPTASLADTSKIRFEFVNDQHARWLPVISPDGGLCIPEGPSANVTEAAYQSGCSASLGGYPRIATRQNELAASDAANDGIVRLVVGDEFQGTPLFTLPDLGPSAEAGGGYGGALSAFENFSTSVGGGSGTFFGTLMVPGNHEFDAGLEIFNNYANDLSKNGAKMICANCDFSPAACMANDLPKSHVFAGVDSSNTSKDIGVWALTVTNLHSVAAVPSTCLVKTWDEIGADFKTFLDGNDSVLIISHMGIKEDVNFTAWCDDNLTSTQKAKILGIYGGHSHSVICGTNGLTPEDDGTTIVDASLGANGIVSCEDIFGWEASVKANLDQAAYSGDIATKGCYPNYPMANKGISIYHNGMHSWQYANFNYNTNGTHVSQRQVLSSSVAMDTTTVTSQLNVILEIAKAKEVDIAEAEEDIIGGNPCKVGYEGCGGGYFYAMATHAAGIEYVMEHISPFTKQDLHENAMVPIGTIVNGGGVRATLPEGELSWVDINTTYPFLNNVSGGVVKGSSLKTNMMHGLIGHGGAQMFGLRIVTRDGFDMAEFLTDVEAAASISGTTKSRYFCESNLRNRHTGLDPLSGRKMVYPEDEVLKAAKVHAQNKGVDRPVQVDYDGKGCTKEEDFPLMGIAFEINICTAGQVADTLDGGEAINYYPPKQYNDCNCWQTITDDADYYLVTADFLANGGDDYCMDFEAGTRYDHQGTYEEELGCTGVAMFFINRFSDFIQNVPKNIYVAAYDDDQVWRTTSAPPTPSSALTRFAGASLLISLIALF